MTVRADRSDADRGLRRLIRDLVLAHSHAELYANELAVAIDHAREWVLNGVVGPFLPCTDDHERATTIRRELLGARDRAVELGRCLVVLDADQLIRVRALVRALDRDLALVQRLRNLLDLAPDTTYDALPVSGAVELKTFMETSCTRGLDLVQALGDSGANTDAPGQPMRWTNQVANGLVRQAVRMVPAAHRSRYDEEFRSELVGVAVRGSRRAQLRYAVRILVRSVALRRELRGTPR